MPRDLFAFPEVPAESMPDMSTPSAEGVLWLLRHPEEWPSDFVWDYERVLYQLGKKQCGCAIGLSGLAWRKFDAESIAKDVFGSSSMWALMFEEIGHTEGARTFGAGQYPTPNYKVTPEMVADRLEGYIKQRNHERLSAGNPSTS